MLGKKAIIKVNNKKNKTNLIPNCFNWRGKFSMKNTYKVVALLAGAALLVAVIVVVSSWAYSQIEKADEMRKHTNLEINHAEKILSELKEAETGQRRYSLTGDAAFLEPYLAVRDSASIHLEELCQLTINSACHKHVIALVPLMAAKLADMSRVYDIEMHRSNVMPAAIKFVGGGQGKRMMDSICAEMSRFIEIEEGVLAQYEATFQSNVRHLFIIIVAANLLTLLFALSFAYLLYRETKHRLENLVHLETQHLLDIQKDTKKQLQ
jgi:CHASE3 domain sensor protein